MLRKIGIILFAILTTGVAGAYFYFTEGLVRHGEKDYMCHNIQVTVLDSASRAFVKPADVKNMIAGQLGKHLDSINTSSLEKEIIKGTAIRNAEIYTVAPDILAVEITQREPIIRIINGNGGYFLDNEGFILPLSACDAQNLPTVTGAIKDSEQWKRSLINYTEIIRNSHYWSKEIEQIVIDNDEHIELYARSIDQKIIFGSMESAREKFEKLAIYYSTILPKYVQQGKEYKVINLKYKDQIICK